MPPGLPRAQLPGDNQGGALLLRNVLHSLRPMVRRCDHVHPSPQVPLLRIKQRHYLHFLLTGHICQITRCYFPLGFFPSTVRVLLVWKAASRTGSGLQLRAPHAAPSCSQSPACLLPNCPSPVTHVQPGIHPSHICIICKCN